MKTSQMLSLLLSNNGFRPKRLVAVTADSVSNIKLARRLLEWQWLSCFCHNFDLTVHKGIDDSCVDHVICLSRKVRASFFRFPLV